MRCMLPESSPLQRADPDSTDTVRTISDLTRWPNFVTCLESIHRTDSREEPTRPIPWQYSQNLDTKIVKWHVH